MVSLPASTGLVSLVCDESVPVEEVVAEVAESEAPPPDVAGSEELVGACSAGKSALPLPPEVDVASDVTASLTGSEELVGSWLTEVSPLPMSLEPDAVSDGVASPAGSEAPDCVWPVSIAWSVVSGCNGSVAACGSPPPASTVEAESTGSA